MIKIKSHKKYSTPSPMGEAWSYGQIFLPPLRWKRTDVRVKFFLPPLLWERVGVRVKFFHTSSPMREDLGEGYHTQKKRELKQSS